MDINECEQFDRCPISTPTCVNFLGSYACCEAGYSGNRCDVDIDECLNLNSCHDMGTCINFLGGYRCECDDGYDAEFRCNPACPNDPTGAPPTASPSTPPTAQPTATSAASPAASSTVPPTPNTAERASGDDDEASSLDAFLDNYSPYIVSALGVILVIQLILAKRSRDELGRREQVANDESEGGDTTDGSDDNATTSGSSSGGSERSVDSLASDGRGPLSPYSSDDFDDV